MQLTSEAPASFRSSAERPGPIGLIREGFADIVSRRRLIVYLVQAGLKKSGADTIFGNVWWVLDPLLQMLVYVVLVSVIFARNQPDYPLFIFAAILPWKWFASAVQDGTVSVMSAGQLIKQIHFPKIVMPLAAATSGVANFAFGLIPLFGLLLLFYRDRLSIWLLAIPVIALVQFLFTLPLAIVLAALNVFYRDISNVMRHIIRLWFYLSPGLYAIDQLKGISKNHPIVADLLLLNPFATLFSAYRNAIYNEAPPDWFELARLAGVSIVLLAGAIWVFKRLEPSFAKVL
ncbi:MAG TPA: ABC transporter permease [Candidatus Limnocylindrales bacterium]|nr:ABC transporter permease [Candidatus Limnocylindrales bacterium]